MRLRSGPIGFGQGLAITTLLRYSNIAVNETKENNKRN